MNKLLSLLLVILSILPIASAEITYTENGHTTAWPDISYDHIKISHQIELCKPVVSNDYKTYYNTYWISQSTCGIDAFQIGDYPLDMLPSGGNSGITSKSEMVMAAMNFNMPILSGLKNQPIHVVWHRQDGTLLCPACDQHLYVNIFSNRIVSIVGRFDWEINTTGLYYVTVDTPWGGERLNFVVADKIVYKNNKNRRNINHSS